MSSMFRAPAGAEAMTWTSASRTCRCPRSSPSRARWTLARVLARAASEVRSLGAGRARSGRRRTSVRSCPSLRLRTSSARLLTAAAGRDDEVDTRHTVVVLGTLACRSAHRCHDDGHPPRARGGPAQAQKLSLALESSAPRQPLAHRELTGSFLTSHGLLRDPENEGKGMP